MFLNLLSSSASSLLVFGVSLSKRSTTSFLGHSVKYSLIYVLFLSLSSTTCMYFILHYFFVWIFCYYNSKFDLLSRSIVNTGTTTLDIELSAQREFKFLVIERVQHKNFILTQKIIYKYTIYH